MGTLMRSIDWSKTGVGPVSGWSHALRTMIGVLLRSRSPMHLSWGPQLVQFYNDAYRPILGAKHPKSMGQPASETWPEIWLIMEPMWAAPLSGQPATGSDDLLLLFDRKGFLEETHFKAAYSAVPDQTVARTGIGGVLAAVAETTAQVFGERQLRGLREVAASASEAKTAEQACELAAAILGKNTADVPFCLFYLIEPDGKRARLVAGRGFGPEQGAANPAFLDLDSTETQGWALTEMVRNREIKLFTDLPQRFKHLPQGAWAEPPRLAIALPIASPEQALPYGVLIAGVSPHRELDDGYQTFFELAAAQVVTAIHNARSHEEARLRVEKLAQLDGAKTAFFNNVSHEFRTPLTLILGTTEDVRARGETLSAAGLDVVHRNSQRLLKLVNTLLDFSRIEAGRARAQLKATDLGELTADLASSFRSLVEKAGLTLTVDCPPLGEPVYVDREMYEKIVLNLISNAFKFTFEGGIRVSLHAVGGQALLTVSDTGVGIPEKELPHLFERFHRVEGTKGRSYEGSGIGLALVQDLAKLHGGMVTAESRLREGSQFQVSFPLSTVRLGADAKIEAATLSTALVAAPFLEAASQWVNEDAQAQGPASGARQQPTVDLQSGRILLADDNADMRAYAQRLLSEQGWQVEAVPDGEAALESARAFPPDLVLADVMMPGLDGFGLLRALKQGEKTRALPVILLSARAGEEAVIEGLAKGADDYLVKPFSAKQLVSVVAARVEIARARAQALRDRAKLYALFMQAPVAVCVLTEPDHVFVLANPLYLEMCGRKDIMGKTLAAAFPELPPDSLAFRFTHRVFSTGQPFFAEEFCVPLDRNGSGVVEDAYFKYTSQPIRDASGQVTEVMVVGVDVTAEVRARRRVESLMAELRLSDRRKDEFLVTLAHELRNPITAISMALSLLERVERNDPKASIYRDTARRQERHLTRLVDDLLDVSRIARGTMQMRNEEVDLASIVGNAVTAIRPMVEARGHDLRVTVEPGTFRLNADSTRLEQVLVNLLTNAAKYTNPGGTISVALAREIVNGAAEAVVRVRDTGHGIPRDMLDKVFELFVQVDPARDRSTGGLGLGLTLVKNLVEVHGGSVSAHSEGGGKGTEMVVRLPLPTIAA